MDYSYDKIMDSIRNRSLRYIGSGSGRSVFDLNNGYVVKVARNRKGIAQNEVEARISAGTRSKLFARVVKVSYDFVLLVMEKAERINSLSEVMRYMNIRSSRDFFRIRDLRDIAENHGLLLADLQRSVNWGRIGDRYVIIDYGFTRGVRRRYYAPF